MEALLITVVGGLLSIIGVLLGYSRARSAQRESQIISRLDQIEREQRVAIDYIHELREHIAHGEPPPPPPWPSGLTK
jgi:hypothetical protein